MQKTKKRDALEIECDILHTLVDRGGSMKPTLLMYATNLSWKPMIVRLERLAKKGLIQFIKNESNQGKRRVDLRTPRFVEITVLGKEELARLRGCLLLRSEELGAS